MKKLGKELEFISRILKDGSGTESVYPDYIETLADAQFKLIQLSITQGTWIACEFNCFVVKLKK